MAYLRLLLMSCLIMHNTITADDAGGDRSNISPEKVILSLFQMDALLAPLRNATLRDVFPRPVNVNSACYDDVITFLGALVGSYDNNTGTYTSMGWAVRAFDASGKPNSGLLAGAVQFVGKFDQCLETRAVVPRGAELGRDVMQSDVTFGMRYCRVQAAVGHMTHAMFEREEDANPYWWGPNSHSMVLNWGLCVPESCNSPDIQLLVTANDSLLDLPLPVQGVVCSQQEELSEDVGALMVICVLCIIGGVVVVCTAVDAYVAMGGQACRDRTLQSRGDEKSEGNFEENLAFTGIQMEGLSPGDPDPTNNPSTAVTLPLEEREVKNGAPPHSQDTYNGGPRNSIRKEKHHDEEVIKENGEFESKYNKSDKKGSQMNTKSAVVDLSDADSKAEHPPDNNVARAGQNEAGSESTLRLVVQAFSLYRNIPKLMSKTSASGYSCIYGIRIISMMWIILGHSYTYGAILDETNVIFENVGFLPSHIGSFIFQMVGSANFSVDTFFVISAFLLMKNSLPEYSKVQQKPLQTKISFWGGFYIKRFWRLTPVYAVVLLSSMFLYDHIVSGPLKADKFEEFHTCKDKWWSHLLYFNNFYQPEKKCMTWSWYLAVDTQFYMISPIFISLVAKNKKLGLFVIGGVLLATIIGSFIAMNSIGGTFIMMDVSFPDYWQWVYSVPWTRCSPYCVGLILGVMMADPKPAGTVSQKWTLLVWTEVLVMGLVLIFLPYDQWSTSSQHWSHSTQAFYEAVSRPMWAVCVAWVIYACSTGRGAVINAFLSWSAFTTPSRLVYCMYLIHPVIIMFVTYSRRATMYMDPAQLTIIYNYIGNLVLTSLFAVVLTLCVEGPMMALDKIIFRRPPRARTPSARATSPQAVKSPRLAKGSPEPSIKLPEPSNKSPELSIKSPETSIKSPEPSIKSPETSIKSPETSIKSPEPSNKSPELPINSHEADGINVECVKNEKRQTQDIY